MHKIQEELKEYCHYTDLKELYNKVMPNLAKFEKRIQEIYNEFEQVKQLVERMDEIVAHKVNKVAFDDLSHRLHDYATKDMLRSSNLESIQRFDLIETDLKGFKEEYALFTNSIKGDIGSAVRK